VRVIFFALYCAAQLLLPVNASQAGVIDSYTCAQFIKDSEDAPNGPRSSASLMVIAWATGYAAAHDKKAARADDAALQLIGSVVATKCSKLSTEKVVDVAVSTIDDFVTTGQPKGVTKKEPTGHHKRRHLR
jgi:hypothetical protein